MSKFVEQKKVVNGPWQGGSDGGGGGGSDMEARVAHLEADMKDVKSVLHDKVVPMLTRIDERLNHTATKVELHEVQAGIEKQLQGQRADIEKQLQSGQTNIEKQLQGQRADIEKQLQNGQANIEKQLAEKAGKGFIVGTALSIVVGGIALIAATIAGMQYLQGTI